MAWVGDIGPAIEIVEAEQDLARGPRHPGCKLQGAGNGPGELVLIAPVPNQPCLLHILAGDVEAHDGAGQRAAFLIDPRESGGAQQLAARDARGIGHEGLGRFQIGIGLEEGFDLPGLRAPRHEISPFLPRPEAGGGRRPTLSSSTDTAGLQSCTGIRDQLSQPATRPTKPG